MQRKRRHPKNPTRRLVHVVRDVNRSFPEWEATLVGAYAPTGSERVLFFRVKDRLSGKTIYQTTSSSDRCVSVERWLRRAKGQLTVR